MESFDRKKEILMSITNIDAMEIKQDPIEILEQRSVCSPDACVVELTVNVHGEIIKAYGTAMRSPGDRSDNRVGELLAFSRAYENLGAKLRRRGNGLVTHNEKIAQQRPLQRRKAQEWRAQQRIRVVYVSANDENEQRQAITRLREQEGSWAPSLRERASGNRGKKIKNPKKKWSQREPRSTRHEPGDCV
jgi:hypothetical protein